MELNKYGYPIWKDSKNFVHISQAEKHVVGRKLKEGEEVHHVDGDKFNFDKDNLIVLSREDHHKIERNMWEYKNIIVVHVIVILLSYIFLTSYLKTKNIYLISLTLLFLLFALVIPLFPRFLRKILFTLRILKKNN